MALVFVPQHQLRFSSDAGNNTQWEIEIHRSYDDTGSTPSWVSNPVTNLTGTGDPLTIEYSRDREVYKPIQGSAAKLNLVIETAGQYNDFNFAGGSPYEYQLVVKYRDSANVLQDYWCGFFNPVGSTEAVTTFPFMRSFTAVDGLGLLEESTPETSAATGQVNAFSTYIIPALQQTGLGLDVYVDSQILNGADDGLLTATTDAQARYKSLEGSGELFTHKELLEGFLSTFNCKITQAKGRWYIYNASILADTTTWKTFNTQGIAGSDAVESLVKTIDGSSSQDLVPANGDLQLNLRRPAGSIECRPKDLVERQYSINGNFGSGDSTGWNFYNTSWANVEAYSEADNGFALRVLRSRGSVSPNGAGDTIGINTPGWNLDPAHEIEFKFDHIWDKIRRTGRSYYRIRATFDSQQYVQVQTQPTYDYAGYYGAYTSDWASYEYVNSTSVNEMTWNSEEGVWQSDNNVFTRFEQEEEDIWANESQTLASISSIFGEMRTITNVRLFVDFYVSHDTTLLAGTSLTNQSYYIDNISAKNVFDNTAIDPVFERVQDNFVHTISYEPLFSSSTSSAIYQTIFPENYGRANKSGESTSIEQIGTQLKLNDFRSEFKYYEGSLINLSTTPLTNIDKIRLNWSSAGYVETANGIMNGGSFSLRNNSFNTAFYIPNQTTDHNGQYFTENVNLVRSQFPGRSELVTYTLAFKVTARDASNVVVDNGLVPSEPFIQIKAPAGDVIHYKLNLVPSTGNIGVVGSTSVTADATNTPRPEYATFTAFGNSQGNIELPLTITVPDQSSFEELYIDGGVIPFSAEESPDVNPGVIVITNSGDDLKANTDGTNMFSYDVSGLPGSVVHFTHHIAPVNSNFQVFGGNFDVTGNGDTNLSNLDATGGPDNVSIDFAYRIPVTGDPTPVTVTGDADAAGIIGVNLQEVNVTFGTAPTNTRFHEASNTFTGVPGDTKDYSITIIPDADYQITSVQAPTLPLGIVANGVPYASGENWEIPIQVTIPALTDPYEVVQTAITQRTIAVSEEPYSLTFNVNDLGISNAMIPAADAVHRITFDESDFGNSITPFVINVNPVSGSMFTSNSDVAVDVNESSVVVADGSTITLPEAQFTAPVQVVSGSIAITVSGTFPSMGGQYTLDVNIVGNNDDGGATLAPGTSTGTTVTYVGSEAGANGGRAVFSIVSDGEWDLTMRGSSGNITTADISTDGRFSFAFASSSIHPAFTQTGSVSPISGSAGTTIVNVDFDPWNLVFDNPYVVGSDVNSSNVSVFLRPVAPGTDSQLGFASGIDAMSPTRGVGGVASPPLGSATGAAAESLLANVSSALPNWTIYG